MTDYPTANSYPGRLRPVRLIVLHTMEVPCTDQATHAVMRNFQDPALRTSAHYGVGPGVTLSGVPETATAWATPGANADGIQIEQAGYSGKASGDPAGTDWTSGPGAAVVARTAALVRDLCNRWNIPRRHLTDAQLAAGEAGIIGHVQASRVYGGTHWDPGETYPWDAITSTQQTSATPTTPTTQKETPEMVIIKSANRKAALIGPASFHQFRNSEEQATAIAVLAPAIKDTLSDRQYDVIRAVIAAGALDATQTRADLATLLADLDKETA